MVLDKISIINYKNIKQTEIYLSPKINCFIGNNGEGKTNFLDAIYYLSFGRSSNNPIDSQLIHHGEDFMLVEGFYSHYDYTDVYITLGIKRGQKKSFKRNGKAYKRLSDHIGFIPLVLITPKDSSLIDDGNEERRNFMNVVISQLDHSYIEALTNYNKALHQRNSMLKSENTIDNDLMEIWEIEMANNGEKIFEKRKHFIEEFIPYFQRIYSYISEGKEEVSLNFISHCQRGKLIDVIQTNREKDRIIGYSLHGIHRDKFEIMMNGYNIKYEGSQGQNKTLVLAMKLAQFEFLKRTVSETTPILLLDDIFDKLDASRVEKIISLVSEDNYGQIFITDTNRDHLDNILLSLKSGYSLFSVKSGKISKF